MFEKYTSIERLQDNLDDVSLVELAVDRSGASINHVDVIARIEKIITNGSRHFDGYVRGHMSVPIQPTITGLTGSITLVPGQKTIVGTSTDFINELAPGDEIRLDGEASVRIHIESITDADHAVSKFVYYGTLCSGAFSLWEPNIPEEVIDLVTDHISFILWGRRGRDESDNPFEAREKQFRNLSKDIKAGLYTFAEIPGGKIVEKKPVHYDDGIDESYAVHKTFTDSDMKDYFAE